MSPLDQTISFERDNGFAVRRSGDGQLSIVGSGGYVLGLGAEDLRWLCHTGGPAILVADEARKRIEGTDDGSK